MTKFIQLIIVTAVAFTIMICYTFVWGYVSYMFYNWFVLGAIPTLPHFNILQFTGFYMFCKALLHQEAIQIDDEYKKNDRNLSMFITPCLVLIFGWLFHVLFF